jgi:hypothetical protein
VDRSCEARFSAFTPHVELALRYAQAAVGRMPVNEHLIRPGLVRQVEVHLGRAILGR